MKYFIFISIILFTSCAPKVNRMINRADRHITKGLRILEDVKRLDSSRVAMSKYYDTITVKFDSVIFRERLKIVQDTTLINNLLSERDSLVIELSKDISDSLRNSVKFLLDENRKLIQRDFYSNLKGNYKDDLQIFNWSIRDGFLNVEYIKFPKETKIVYETIKVEVDNSKEWSEYWESKIILVLLLLLAGAILVLFIKSKF